MPITNSELMAELRELREKVAQLSREVSALQGQLTERNRSSANLPLWAAVIAALVIGLADIVFHFV